MSSPLSDLLTEQDLAGELGLTVRTLRRWRALRESPPYVRIGRQIFYRSDAVRAWLLARERAA